MGCILALLALVSPRLGIVVLWLFTERMDRAFDSGLVAVLGFVFLPLTTFLYALVDDPVHGLTGIDWFLVAIGFVIDLGTTIGSGGVGRSYRRR